MADRIMSQVQVMYDESGHYWNDTRNKGYGKSKNWPIIQKYLDTLTQGQSVLDVGCGNGRLISGLPQGVGYTGIDFSQTLLSAAKGTYPQSDFRFGNITETHTWEGLETYDAIFCIAVLHHLPTRQDHIRALQFMRGHGNRNCRLVLTVWNLWQERFLQSHLDSALLKKTNPRWVDVPFANKWKRFCFQMDIPYLTDVCLSAGWEIEEIYFADSAGEKADIQTGANLVVTARISGDILPAA